MVATVVKVAKERLAILATAHVAGALKEATGLLAYMVVMGERR